MAEDQVERLAAALEALAANLRPLPPQGQGINLSVIGGGPGSRTTGIRQTLTATGDGQTLIGFQSIISDVEVNQAWEQTTGELRKAAEAVRAKQAPKEWITSLITRVGNMGAKAIEGGLVEAAKEIADAAFS